MALGFVFGAVSSLPLLVVATPWAFALWAVAGGLTAWFVSSKRRGLAGLLLGVSALYALAGVQEVREKFEWCAGTCSGMSSPTFTLWLVIAFGVAALLVAAGGYVAGRLLHWLVIGRKAGSAA